MMQSHDDGRTPTQPEASPHVPPTPTTLPSSLGSTSASLGQRAISDWSWLPSASLLLSGEPAWLLLEDGGLPLSPTPTKPPGSSNSCSGGEDYRSKRHGVKVLVAQSIQLFVTPWTVAHQALLGISQARILELVAIPFPRGCLDPGIKPGLLH